MQLPSYLTSALAPVHRAGWPFVAGGLVVSLLLALVAAPLFWLGLLITAWIAYFFRDPVRVTPEGDAVVVSPADGVVQAIAPRCPPAELELGEAPMTCISIFLNVLDVHVNRAPVGGRIAKLAYHPGKFLNAADDKASDDNERQSFRIETAQGEVVHAGERVGLIRFGSRCDVYLPAGVAPLVLVGQRAIAGETVLADGRRNQVYSGGRRS